MAQFNTLRGRLESSVAARIRFAVNCPHISASEVLIAVLRPLTGSSAIGDSRWLNG